MKNIIRILKSTHSDVIKYLVTAALVRFSMFGLVMVIFNLYLLRLNYDTRFIGIANGCTPLAFALTGILAGILGKNWGSKKTMTLGVICFAFSISLLPATQLLSAENAKIAIIFLRFLTGSGFAFFHVTLEPYLVSATTKKERVLIFSVSAGTGPAAAFLGSLLAGFMPAMIANHLGTDISNPLPFAYLLCFSGLVVLLAIPLIGTTQERLKPTKTNRTKSQKPAVNPILLVIIFLGLSLSLRSAGESVVDSFFNVYLELVLHEKPWRIGLIMAAGQLLALPASLFAHNLAAKTGKLNGTVIALCCMGTSFFIFISVNHWIITSIGYALYVSSRSIALALSGVVHMESVPAKFRSVFSGFLALIQGIGYGSMSLLGGFLIPRMGFNGLFLIGSVTLLLSATIFRIYLTTPHKQYE